MEIKAVFFDAGGTLVYPHPSFAEAFAEVVSGNGHRVLPREAEEALAGHADRFTEASLEGRLWTTSADRSRAFWLDLYGDLLGRMGIPDEDGSVAAALYARFSDLSAYRLYGDVPPALERLDRAGLRMGVVSNFEAWLEPLLERLGVTRYFPIRVISGIEGVEKPDPRIFEIALERAGVAPGEAAYVGDHPLFDVEAAAGVGMLPVLIDRHDRFPSVEAARIASLEDLPEAIGLA